MRSGQFETSAGIPAIIGGNITVSGETKLATGGSTTTCGGNLSVSKQATILGPLVATKGFYIGSEDFYINGNQYAPKEITLIDKDGNKMDQISFLV